MPVIIKICFALALTMSSIAKAEVLPLLGESEPNTDFPYLAAVLDADLDGGIQSRKKFKPLPADISVPPQTVYPAATVNPFLDYPRLKDYYVPYEAPGYIDRSFDYLVESRDKLTSALEITGRKMDAYFAGEEYQIYNNESYAILRMGGAWIEGGQFDPDFDAKFRLDLPGTKERYRLVLQYGDDNDRTLEERNRPSETAKPVNERNSLFAGLLRTLDDVSGKWETKFSAGIKVKIPPDPFVRTTGVRYFQLSSDWNLQLQGQAEWFNSSGFHGGVNITMDHLISDSLLFRSQTLFDWREEIDSLEFGQVFSVYQQLKGDRAIEYQLGGFGNGYSYSEVNIVYLSAAYRSNLYKGWLYLNLIPEVAFPREENFHQTFSLTALFEIHFR